MPAAQVGGERSYPHSLEDERLGSVLLEVKAHATDSL